MATHSSILAWKTLWMEKPGGLQSMELQRVGCNFSFTLLSLYLSAAHHMWDYISLIRDQPGSKQ